MNENQNNLPEVSIKDGQYLYRGLVYNANNEIVGRWDKKHDTKVEDKEEWIPAISIEELYKKDLPPMLWVIKDLFSKRTINQISAPPNQWKTWITWHMAICIAKGTKVFGQFEVEQQAVMIVNEEDPEIMLQQRALLLLDKPESLPLFIHVEKGIKLETKTVDLLLLEAKDKNIGTIIFDSLSVIHTAEENSATEMGKVFEEMKRFTREGITVLFTNHHRKKGRESNKRDDIQEQTRGSTVINAVPSGHITCEENKTANGTFVIIRQAKIKGAEKLDSFAVKIVKSENHIDFIYDGKHEDSLDAATQLKNQIFKILWESKKWIGINDIKETTGRSPKPIRDQVAALMKAGQIEMKTRSELVSKGLEVSEREKPKGQEYLYRITESLEEENPDLRDLEPVQLFE